VNQIRKRLTYANVMSSIAVFLLLGGGAAFAAGKLAKNSVGSKQIKKNAVTSAKIKKNAVTTSKIKNGAVSGAKINLGTLGTVPNATHAGTADNATNANNAGNANTVGGLHIVKFGLNGGDNIGQTQILNFNGLQLLAECSSGDTTLIARTTTGGSEISAFAADASGEDFEFEYEDDFDPGDDVTLPPNSNSDVLGNGFFTGGNLQTVQFFYNEEDEIPGGECVFNGYAIG
jgi:hypothetical protein